MPVYEKAPPIHISLLGAEAIVHVADTLSDLIEQANRLQRGHARFYGSFIPVFLLGKSA